MYNPLVIVSSIVYHYLIYSNNVLFKYFVKPLTTILIIGASSEAVSDKTNKSKNKMYGKVIYVMKSTVNLFKLHRLIIFAAGRYISYV
jgi:hypothetical protein